VGYGAYADSFVNSDILWNDPIATYNPVDTSHLIKVLPEIHFSEYFASFTPRSYPERVVITYPAYPASLSKILSNTSSDVVEAYLVVRAALRLAPLLGLHTEAWKAVRTLDETLKGIKKGAVGDRAEFCVGQVERALGFAAGRYFVNTTFGGESRKKGTKVINGKLHTSMLKS
jgi:endothelin-converting enzyme